MNRYQLVSLSGAHKGAEEKFQQWYTSEHVPDVLKLSGALSAQVHKISATMGNVPWGLMAVYTFETDNPDGIITEIHSRIGAGTMRLSDAIDMSTVSLFVTLAT